MALRLRKHRPRWRANRARTDTGLSFLREMNWFYVKTPPRGFPGLLMAAVPFLLLAGLAWYVPGFWQVPALVAVGVVIALVILRIDWPRSVKTGFAVAVAVGSAVAFAVSSTEVGPFVLPVLAAGLALSFLRTWAMERDTRDRDSWKKR